MTVTAKVLLQAKYIETIDTLQFTATTTTIVDAVAMTNVGALVAEVSLSLVPFGGLSDLENRLMNQQPIRYHQTFLASNIIGQVLNTGDFISAFCDLANTVNIRISGREIT